MRDWVIDVSEYDKLMEWTSEQWLEVFKKYFIDNPSVSLLLKPSKELTQKRKQDAKDRIAATKQKYGPEGLKNFKKLLIRHRQRIINLFPNQFLTSSKLQI